MNHFLKGFADELEKTALLGRVGKFIAKRPMATLMGAGVLADTAQSAASGYKGGLRGGEAGRYLQATRTNPGRAAYTSYHQLFPHKPSQKSIKSLSKHHKPGMFRKTTPIKKKD